MILSHDDHINTNPRIPPVLQYNHLIYSMQSEVIFVRMCFRDEITSGIAMWSFSFNLFWTICKLYVRSYLQTSLDKSGSHCDYAYQ